MNDFDSKPVSPFHSCNPKAQPQYGLVEDYFDCFEETSDERVASVPIRGLQTRLQRERLLSDGQ